MIGSGGVKLEVMGLERSTSAKVHVEDPRWDAVSPPTDCWRAAMRIGCEWWIKVKTGQRDGNRVRVAAGSLGRFKNTLGYLGVRQKCCLLFFI